MGLFSWDCEGCGHPALMPENTTPGVNEWMSECVAITREGTIVEGFYDGYGRLADTLANVPGWDENGMYTTRGKTDINGEWKHGPTLFHRACWELFGHPAEYTGESKRSKDQGHFFDPPRHDMERPTALMNLRFGHKAKRGV